MQHFNISVRGRVQGVYFRASARDTAEALELKGFVRNEDDNSVYIEAEGDVENLEKLVSWCKQGPPHAKVESVDVWPGPIKTFNKFDIRR